MELFDNRYKQLDLIGRGSFSEVWKVLDTETNVIQALKIYRPEKGISNDGIEMLKHEYALLNDPTHPNLLRPSFFMFSGKKNVPPYLILTFCEKGNVSKLIRKLEEHELWRLIRDTASALAYLHAKNPPIIHQDIKPENILVSNDGIYQLTDFGISIQAKSDNVQDADKQMQSAGTISYMAPERFAPDSMPIMASDVYSLGVTLFELASGYLPFGNSGGLAQLKENAEIPQVPWNYSSLLKETIRDCLRQEPWKRPIAAKLEEIANSALTEQPAASAPEPAPVMTSDAPHVHQQVVNEKPVEVPHTQPIHQRPYKKIILGVAAAILVVMAGIWGFHAMTDQDAQESVEAVQLEETVLQEQEQDFGSYDEVAEPMEQEQSESPVEEETVQQESPPVIEKPLTDSPKPVAKEPQKPKSSSIELGYAEWKGETQNGKPHGYGTMTFRSSHRIDSRDPQCNIAENGDKVEGNYSNGHLEYGTWIKSTGERIQIFIGQ